MTSRRNSKTSELAPFASVLAGLVACAGAPLETSLELKDATRKPDGVLLEPAPAIPPVEERGKAQAGVLALRQPVSDDQIADLARDYVRRFAEGTGNWDNLIDTDGVMLDENGRASPRPVLMQSLRARYQQHEQDYLMLRGQDLVRADRLQRYATEDLGPHTDPPRPTEMKSGDVYARIALDPRMSSNGDPLFRSWLVMIVRRTADRKLRIAGLAETDSL